MAEHNTIDGTKPMWRIRFALPPGVRVNMPYSRWQGRLYEKEESARRGLHYLQRNFPHVAPYAVIERLVDPVWEPVAP